MKRPVEDGLSMLIGAGLGVAFMYLLDPEEGLQRREQIQKAARDRLGKAQDRLSHAGTAASANVGAGLGHLQDAVGRAAHSPTVQKFASHATDAAKALYNDISSHASEAAAQAGAAAGDYEQQAVSAAEALRSKLSGQWDHLRDHLRGQLPRQLPRQLRDKANDLSDDAKAKYGKWLNKSTAAMGRDEDHHYISQTVCALGSLALGAGAVYLFDPDQGQDRREHLIGRTSYAVREIGDFFRKTGRRLVSSGQSVANRVADQAKETVRDWTPGDTREPAEHEAAGHADSEAPVSTEPANESNQASMGT